MQAETGSYAFGPFRLDVQRRSLTCRGERVELTPVVFDMLACLVANAGRVVSKDELLAAVWPGRIVSESSLSHTVFVLRRALEQADGAEPYIATAPGRGYRFTAAVRAESAGDGPDAIPRPAWRAKRWLIGAGALVAVVAAGLWVAVGAPGWSVDPKGVAVLTFDAPAGDRGARELADTVGDEVAAGLARADFKSSLPAARPTGVAFTVGGRVQRDGPGLQVLVAVADARRREILWSSSLSGQDAVALQGQVAAKVAGVLHCALDADTSRGVSLDPESLRLYLSACDLTSSGDPDDLFDGRVLVLLRQVVQRNPRFAGAWAEIAMASQFLPGHGAPEQVDAARREARAAAERALQLNPRIGLAYAALADLAETQGDRPGLDAMLRKGLAIAPDDAQLNVREANLVIARGRLHDAAAYASRAAATDPLQPYFAAQLAAYLTFDGRFAEARKVIERAARTWPDDVNIQSTRISIEGRSGDPDRALALVDDPRTRPVDWKSPLVDDFRKYLRVRRSRDPAEVAAYASETLAELAAGRTNPSKAVLRLTSLGATDSAFAAAAKARDARDLDTGVLFRGVPGTEMWRDRRFMPLAARLGLVDIWRRSGKWPDFCDAPDRPYDCRAAAANLP